MTYFVLAYDRTRGQIADREDYPAEERERAWSARDRLVRKYASMPDVEVVLLGAASEAVLRVTHGRYFEPVPISIPR
jgi:hypothetical protein